MQKVHLFILKGYGLRHMSLALLIEYASIYYFPLLFIAKFCQECGLLQKRAGMGTSYGCRLHAHWADFDYVFFSELLPLFHIGHVFIASFVGRSWRCAVKMWTDPEVGAV